MVLERRGCWRWLSAGVKKEARTGFPNAGASIALACEERWRWEGSQNGLSIALASDCAACEERWR